MSITLHSLLLDAAIVVVLLVLGLMVLAGERKNVQRRQRLRAWAREHGLRFDPDRNTGLQNLLPSTFRCLQQGLEPYASNIMRGEWSKRTCTAFDYHYLPPTRQTRGILANRFRFQFRHFSAVVLESEVPLSDLLIRPEHLGDKLLEAFGAENIAFESAEFSRRFTVQASDRRWAYVVLHPRAMELLLASPEFHIQFDHQMVIAWRSRMFQPEQFAEAADRLAGLLDSLPGYVAQPHPMRKETV